MAPAPGSTVAYWRDDTMAYGVVIGEEKQRLVVVTREGKDERVAPARVTAVLAGGIAPARTSEGVREAAARAAAAGEAVGRLVDAVDVPTLWDLVHERGETLSESTLADLALGRVDEAARLATVIALGADGVRFQRKTSGWLPRDAAVVTEILDGRRKAAERAAEKGSAIEALVRAVRGDAFVPSGSETERKILAALEAVALDELDTPEKERALAHEAITASRIPADRLPEAAFRLLRLTGRFASDDENLMIVRYGLRTEFPPFPAVAPFAREGRLDLTAVPMVTIDDPQTREIDDALSVTDAGDGKVVVGIHIADPAAVVPIDGPVDVEALARGTTYYFPERKLLMLPGAVSEDEASLVQGKERPGVSFLATVDAGGRTVSFEIARSLLRIGARLDYDEADAALSSAVGPHAALLARLLAFAEARDAVRRAAGAVSLRAPEAEIRVGEGGAMTLTRRDPDTPSQRIVSEAMILAGEMAAGWLTARGIPAIFRRQAPSDGRLPEADPALPFAVHVRAVRRMLKRAETSLQPGPHHGLGVAAYAQVTSPLRRYQDLAVHRQIAAVLGGGPPPYDVPAMQRILAATERAELEARRSERAVARYWMLRWLDRARGGSVTGVVVETSPRPIVVLDETLLEEVVPSLSGVNLGDRVRLRIERVNPRADLVILRPV
ncbi:MAG TPA: RNB domain-containing ribonuclease [Candidatus Polarisedimenticolaceae bacterium]|nr:RNB domain-containing ribonuclease [Candidatus Polarisedimenticolaceae bacterium]